jgi:hypothetical protein
MTIRTRQTETAIHAAICTIKATMEDIRGKSPYHIPKEDIADFIDNMTGIINNRYSPEHYLQPIGSGAFKECFYTGVQGWIVKFASECNPTGAERQIHDLAHQWGIGDLFIPTYFIDLPESLDSSMLDDEYGNYYEYQGYNEDRELTWRLRPRDSSDRRQLISIQIQPLVQIQQDLPFEYDHAGNEAEYNKAPLTFRHGEVVPLDTYARLGVTSKSWAQHIIDEYGAPVFLAFHDFIDEFDISDLHNANIGYLNNKPIILDWMSDNVEGRRD